MAWNSSTIASVMPLQELPYLDHWDEPTAEMEDYVADFGGEPSMERDSSISRICRQAARYYVALVIVFGVFGNAGCLICYRRSEELKRYRSTGYLMALALSDLTFLLSLLFVWLKSVGINWHDAPVVCQTSVYASNASIFLSAWYVMALTGEMAFALRRPYSAYAAAVDASKTVVLRIFIVTVVGLAVNSWTLALTKTGTQTVVIDDQPLSDQLGPESDSVYESVLDLETFSMINVSVQAMPPLSYDAGCHISSNNQVLHVTFVLLDLAITYSIPFAITLLLNCYIGYKLIQAGRQRRHMSHYYRSPRPAAIVCQLSQNGHQSSVQTTFPRDSLNRIRRCGQQLEHCPFTAVELSRLNSGQPTKKSTYRGPTIRNKEAAVSSLLIAKSIAYLIFNTPSIVHRIWSMWKRQTAASSSSSMTEEKQPEVGNEHANENWIQLIIYLLFFTQFSVNFLLYSWHAYSRRKCRGTSTAKAILKSYHTPANCF